MSRFLKNVFIVSLTLVVSLAFGLPASCDVVINELMYHPASDNDNDDFLELYNTGSTSVNLEGWSLDGVTLTFEAGATIDPGGYLVLAKDPVQFLSTYGFSPDFGYSKNLSNGGESVQLIDNLDQVVDEVEYDDEGAWPITPDELGPSLERIDPTLDGNTPRNWRASTDASNHTAGAVNSVNGTGLPPWITDVSHSTMQADTATVATATVEDASTVDLIYVIAFGSEVSIAMLDDGLNGDGAAGDGVYGATIPSQPISTLIRYRIEASGTTGNMNYPRTDDTQTYTGGYIEDPSVTSSIPILHWLMDPIDYQALVDRGTNPEDIFDPALIYFENILYEVQVRIRGGSSRSWPKKNLKVEFPKGHDFSAAALAVPVDEFNLQSSYGDKSYLREVLSYETIRDSGSPSNVIAHVHLRQNGEFFGLYLYLEHPDSTWVEARESLDEDGVRYKAYDDMTDRTIEELATRYEKKNPKDDDYSDLKDLVSSINTLTGQPRREYLFDNIDIPGMVNYLACLCLIHENDAPHKNYFLYQDTEGTERWVMHPWDKDLTFGRNFCDSDDDGNGEVLNDIIWANVDSIADRANVSPSHPLFGDSSHQKFDYQWNKLINVLYQEDDFKEMYFRRLRTLMDEQLVDGYYEARIDSIVTLISTEADLDKTKWGQYGTAQTLTEAVNILKNDYLIPRRTHLFTTHRVENEIPVAQTTAPTVVINEIMYNPVSDDSDDEFLELYNPSFSESVDLSGWTLEDGIDFIFPSGSVILPRGYLLVVGDDAQFRDTYGSGLFVAAQYSGGLSNGGENIVLKDTAGTTIDEVSYDDETPWATEPDGSGPSLELYNPFQDNNASDNWAASNASGGTPGAENSNSDLTFPSPNPPGFSVAPYISSVNVISMTAITASDANGVEYYFTETSGNPGGDDSGWQDSSAYTDDGLSENTQYTYTVKVRDKSGFQNETESSAAASATTGDHTPPTPNPMGFLVPPVTQSETVVGMTALSASDPSGVEYYFEETTGRGYDSGWTSSIVFVPFGLDDDTTYKYRVKARDKSPNQNETAWSAEYSVKTEKSGCGTAPVYRDTNKYGSLLSKTKVFLPLIPSLILLGIWAVQQRRRND